MDLSLSCDRSSQINMPFYRYFSKKTERKPKIAKNKNTYFIDEYTTSNNSVQEGSMTMNSESIKIDYLEVDGLRLRFIKPLFLNYTYDGKYYQYEDRNLNYFGIAETLDEMVEQFKEDIYSDWMVYVEDDSVQLSKRAKILKNKLLLLLERMN